MIQSKAVRQMDIANKKGYEVLATSFNDYHAVEITGKEERKVTFLWDTSRDRKCPLFEVRIDGHIQHLELDEYQAINDIVDDDFIILLEKLFKRIA